MIRISRSPGGQARLHLEGEASSALVDADWIPAGDGLVSAPYVAADGGIWYRDRQLFSDAADPAALIRGWISVLVDEVVGLVRAISSDRVQVTGQGMTAEQVRQRAGVASITAPPSPRAIIEMTGRPAELRKATESVADGGLIVLGGESNPPVEINLYKDVHRRGLHVLGASFLGASRHPGADEGRVFPEPVEVRAGEPLPFGLWYRVTR